MTLPFISYSLQRHSHLNLNFLNDHFPVICKSLSLFLEDNVKYLGAKGHHLCGLLLNCRTTAKTVMFVIRDRKRGSDQTKGHIVIKWQGSVRGMPHMKLSLFVFLCVFSKL